MGQQVFYGALWGSVLVSPLVRLPASVFIVTHFDRMVSLRQQTHMLGHDHRLVVSFCFWTFWSLCNGVFGTITYSLVFVFHFLMSCLAPSYPQVKSLCLSLQDSNVLVQRNMLEVLLYFFPFAELLVNTHLESLTSHI